MKWLFVICAPDDVSYRKQKKQWKIINSALMDSSISITAVVDPHISPEAAKVQLPIVAAASGLSEEEVQNIVDNNTEKKVFGIFGEEKVNVLECNIDIAEAMNEI